MPITSQAYFNPKQISGCALWYDAADPLGTGTAPSSGTTITSWKDKSGNANHATGQVSAVTGSDSVGAFLNFQGTTYYTIGSGAFIVNQNFTIFIVERLQSSGVPGAYQHHLIGNITAGPANAALHIRYSNTIYLLLGYYSNDLGTGSVVPAFTTVDAQPDRMLTFNQLSSGRNIYVNSTNVASDANTTLLSGWASPVIGQSFSGYYYVGKLREIIFYTGELSSTQRQQVEGYLAQKWSLAGSLPGTHPGVLFPFYRSVSRAVAVQPYYTVFSPKSISGCALWLDASDSTTITGTTTVTAWRDKSSNAYTMVNQVGTSSLSTNALNGMNAIYVPNTAIMKITNFAWRTKFTLFVVGKCAVGSMLLGGNGSGFVFTGNYALLARENVSGNGISIQDSVNALGVSVVTPNTWFIFCIGYNNVDNATASPYKVNGTDRFTRVDTSFPGSTTVADIVKTNDFYINSTNGLSTNTYDSDYVAELIIYNDNLTNTQAQQVESYLAAKWGLLSNLPGSHLHFTQPAGLPAANPSLIRVLTYVGNTNLSGINYFNIGQTYWTSYWQPYLQNMVKANASATSQTVGGGISGSGPGSAAYFGATLAPNGMIYCIPGNATSVGMINPGTSTFTTNSVSGTAPGNVAYFGGVLAPNGMIYCIPCNATSVGMINPTTNVYTTNSVSGTAPGSGAYRGGVLAPNGMIYCIPSGTTSVGVINPTTNVFTTNSVSGTVSGSYIGGVLAPNGLIYCVPSGASTIGVIDPNANTFTTFGSVSGNYMGGALGQNGMIYLIPRNSTVVGKINPMTNIYTTFGSVSSGVDLYCTGVFAPNGLIYCISQNSGTFATINPATDTYTTISGTVQGGGGYYSACLAPNGVIYIIPCNATTIATITISGLTQLPNTNYCLSIWANKF